MDKNNHFIMFSNGLDKAYKLTCPIMTCFANSYCK